MDCISSAKLSFNGTVKFYTEAEISETMEEWGLESVDQVMEELDAVGFVSVHLEEKDGNPCDEEGYLFIF